MVIKRRKIKLKPKSMTPEMALNRMVDIVEAHGDEGMARVYFTTFHKNMLARLQSIAAKAEKQRDWSFMEGCYKQATELYVLASVLYEKFPEHMILSDGAFDAMSRFMMKHRKHMDKDFLSWYNVTAMGLKAGSGYNVAARDPIPQYVYLITGQRIEEDDGRKTPQDGTRVLRRVKPKPAGKRGSGGKRKPPRRRLRKSE
jgi:hypothetical protein